MDQQQQPANNNNITPVVKPKPVTPLQPEECFTTVVIGETGVGKTFQTNETIKRYIRDFPKFGKRGRKCIVLNFQNEDAYARYRTLDPTPQAIQKFVGQKTVEARQITPFDEHGHIIDSKRKVEILKLVSRYFRNGLAVYDDIDGYAVFSGDKDLIGSLMGNRHKGLDNIFSHQSWRKMTVTELENVRFLRLHKALDSPLSMDEQKRACIDFDMCMIAHFVVLQQYELATDMHDKGELTYEQYVKHKSYFVNIDVRKKKMHPVSENNFNLAVKRYCGMNQKLIQEELNKMEWEGMITHKQMKSPEAKQKALDRLQERFRKQYLKAIPNKK